MNLKCDLCGAELKDKSCPNCGISEKLINDAELKEELYGKSTRKEWLFEYKKELLNDKKMLENNLRKANDKLEEIDKLIGVE